MLAGRQDDTSLESPSDPLPGCSGELCSEYAIIKNAADRNGCYGDNLVILLAIRMAENGRPGREFGVLHKRAIGTDLDTQAGWAAASIMANRKRNPGLEGEAFIEAMGRRYCPPAAHPLNVNWSKNVTYWYRKLGETL